MIKETTKNMLKRAYSFCSNGGHDASLELLEDQERISRFSPQEAGEAAVLAGLNHWKKGEEEKAFYLWDSATSKTVEGWTKITEAGARAGLSMYYLKRGKMIGALRNAQIALDLFSVPTDATLDQVMILKACGITLAKAGEFEYAEEVLRRVAEINKQFEKSDDPVIVREAMFQRAGNGCSLVSLVLIPQERWDEALRELLDEVVWRYVKIVAEADLAAANHQLSKVWKGKGNLYAALAAEESSKFSWERCGKEDALDKIEAANRNIVDIKAEITETMRERK